MGGKLPELNGRETRSFFETFARTHTYNGVKVRGVSHKGKPFVVDVEHASMGMRRDIVSKALNYLGVSRDEFFEWYRRR